MVNCLWLGVSFFFLLKTCRFLEEKGTWGVFAIPRRCLGLNYARLSAFKSVYPQGGRSLRHQCAIFFFLPNKKIGFSLRMTGYLAIQAFKSLSIAVPELVEGSTFNFQLITLHSLSLVACFVSYSLPVSSHKMLEYPLPCST